MLKTEKILDLLPPSHRKVFSLWTPSSFLNYFLSKNDLKKDIFVIAGSI